MKNAYLLKIDGALFKAQRVVLDEFLSGNGRLTAQEQDALEGIRNLLDSVADQAHDQYGIDCLNFTAVESEVISR